MEKRDVTKELWREYDFGGRVIRFEQPYQLWTGSTTHRLLLGDEVTCVPAPGVNGCVLRWKPKDAADPVQF
jgi:hypothetical protein